MHLILLNVVPHLWKLFAGLKLVNKRKEEKYIIPKTAVTLIGTELRRSRPTVPMAQARSLRNIDVHHKSFKALDWMHYILCRAEVLRTGRIPSDYYDIFMSLCRACRLSFRPKGVSAAEIQSINKNIKFLVTNYYAKIHRGTAEWLPLCLSIAAFPILSDPVDVKKGDQPCETVSEPSIRPDKVDPAMAS